MNCQPGSCLFPEPLNAACTVCGASPAYSIQALRISRDLWLHKHARLTDQVVEVGLRCSRFETALRDVMEMLAACTNPAGDGMILITCKHPEITEMLMSRLSAACILLGITPTRKEPDD